MCSIFAASFFFPIWVFFLLLCANEIRLRQVYNNLLAPLVQSELLILVSVPLTFLKAHQPTPVFPKRDRD